MSLENVTAQPVDRAITLAAACLEFKFSRTEDITLPTSSRRPRVNNVTIACHKDLENMKEQYLQDLDFTEIMTNLKTKGRMSPHFFGDMGGKQSCPISTTLHHVIRVVEKQSLSLFSLRQTICVFQSVCLKLPTKRQEDALPLSVNYFPDHLKYAAMLLMYARIRVPQ